MTNVVQNLPDQLKQPSEYRIIFYFVGFALLGSVILDALALIFLFSFGPMFFLNDDLFFFTSFLLPVTPAGLSAFFFYRVTRNYSKGTRKLLSALLFIVVIFNLSIIEKLLGNLL